MPSNSSLQSKPNYLPLSDVPVPSAEKNRTTSTHEIIHDIPKSTDHLFLFFSQLGYQVLDRMANALFTHHDDDHILGVLWNPNDRSRDCQQQDF